MAPKLPSLPPNDDNHSSPKVSVQEEKQQVQHQVPPAASSRSRSERTTPTNNNGMTGETTTSAAPSLLPMSPNDYSLPARTAAPYYSPSGGGGGLYNTSYYPGTGGTGGLFYGGGGMGMLDAGGIYGMNPMMPSGALGGYYYSNHGNFLFQIQNLILTVTQSVQIISMNAHHLQHLGRSLQQSLQQAYAVFQQERHKVYNQVVRRDTEETLEQKQRRRKLQALRWTFTVALTYAVYQLILRGRKRRFPMLQQR